MFQSYRIRFESWLTRVALDFVCSRLEHYSALREFLERENLAEMMAGELKGRRLTFHWERDLERGVVRSFAGHYNAESPIFARVRKKHPWGQH